MTKYEVIVYETVTYKLIIEADSQKQAVKKLKKQGYNHTNIDEAELIGIEVWEIN